MRSLLEELCDLPLGEDPVTAFIESRISYCVSNLQHGKFSTETHKVVDKLVARWLALVHSDQHSLQRAEIHFHDVLSRLPL